MAPPSVTGITTLGTFESGLQTGTKFNVGGSGSSIFINDATAPKTGIDGGLSGNLAVEAFSGTYGGVRHTHANLQAGAPTTRDFSNTKFIWHFSTDFIQNLDTRANGGYRLRLYSNSGLTIYREWNIQGSDSNYVDSAGVKKNPEAWRSIILDVTNSSLASTTVGAFDAATIHTIELQVNPSSNTVTVITWHDRYGSSNGMTLTAGDSPSPGTFNSFYRYADVDTFKGFIVPTIGSAYAFKLPIAIGDGSTATRFVDSDKYIEFAKVDTTSDNPQLVILPINFLGIVINQSASDYFSSTRVTYASTSKWRLTISGSTSATFIWSGGVISNVGTNSLGGAAAFTGVIFSKCDQLNPTSNRSFAGCTFTESTGTDAAFNWDGTQSIAGAGFTNNTTPLGAIRIANAGTYTLSSNTFSGNTNDFVVVAPSGTVTIIVDSATTTDKTWANTAAGVTANGVNASGSGANVVFQIATATITLTGLLEGTEIRVYNSGTTTEIAGTETSSTSFSFTPTGYSTVDIAILSDAYKNRRIIGYSVPASNVSIPIEQLADRDYSNP